MIIGGEKRKNLVYKKKRCIIQNEIKYIMKEKSKSVITFLIDIQ